MIQLLSIFLSAHFATAGVYAQPGDAWDNGQLACQRVLKRQLGKSWQAAAERYGVAHRSAPCGAWLVVCARRCSIAVVADRGPYGALTRHGYKVRRVLGERERYRGDFDLRVGLARAIGFRGAGAVAVAWYELNQRRNIRHEY